MNKGLVAAIAAAVFTIPVVSAHAQAPREDAVWARVAGGPITLDGSLAEPSWAQAESVTVVFGEDAGIPGSGWKIEGGAAVPNDPVTATLKFLVSGNQLYLGAEVQDASVGGSDVFNRFDGFLMALKDHADTSAPKPPAEHLYSWWFPDSTVVGTPLPPGYPPGFVGKWAAWPPGSARDSTQIANWDAVTVVHGLANDDSVIDTGYTVEMRFNLEALGYDVTQPAGDIVEWNISIYDCDWLWPIQSTVSFKRVWWQCPWGNDIWYNEVRIHARPDVTVSSGPAPTIGPELVFEEVSGTPPTIDGALSEAIWTDPAVYSFDIRWDDDALRQTYPGIGPFRAGQYQPTVNGGQALVLDPADATVSVFFQGDKLYVGFDVRDLVVQFHPDFDRWDGALVTLNDRAERGNDNQLLGRRLGFQVGAGGTAVPQDYLATLVTAGLAQVAVHLNAGTTVDTLGQQADNGYTAEMAIDLTGLGYPSGLGDGTLFLGVNLLDGDSFLPTTDSYGTRTWWFRQYEGTCCPAWTYLERSAVDAGILAGADADLDQATTVANPSSSPSIRFAVPQTSRVTLEVFDVAGRLVERRELGLVSPGSRDIPFDTTGRLAGVYLYRLSLSDPETGTLRTSLHGKAVVVK